MTPTSEFLLQNLYNRTEVILQKAIGEWQLLPAAALAAAPAPGKWSAAQCLQHLNFYGDHYLPAIEKAINKARSRGDKPSATFTSGWLGAYFTRLMLPQQNGTLPSTMQAPKNAVPDPTPDPVQMLATFITQQEKMLQLLEAAKRVNLNTNRVPISLSAFIRLKMGDTFGFVIAHNERHVLQAERSLSARKLT
jgi:DinB superfamily